MNSFSFVIWLCWINWFWTWIFTISYLFAEISDCIEDFIWCLSWYLFKLISFACCEVFAFLFWNSPLTIWFITNQNDRNVFVSIVLCFWHPKFGNVFKRLGIRNVIDHNNTICSFIIRTSNSPKSILAGSIPDLEFDTFSIYFECFEPKF